MLMKSKRFNIVIVYKNSPRASAYNQINTQEVQGLNIVKSPEAHRITN